MALYHALGCPTQLETGAYPRNKISIPVIAVGGKHLIKGSIVDLSLSGAFMLLPELADPTQPVTLTIDLPEFGSLVLSAELVRFDIRLRVTARFTSTD